MTRVAAYCSPTQTLPKKCRLSDLCAGQSMICGYFCGIEGKRKIGPVTVLCSAPTGKGKTK